MNENTNNQPTENLRDKLSEMDKIFIPKDLDNNVDLSDLISYKGCTLKFWRSVPQNFRLVKVNIFTKKVIAKDGFGFKFAAPLFTRTILVPITAGTKRFNSLQCTTSDGIDIKIDLAVVMRITDPAKYMDQGKTQLEQLTALINRLLRVYTASREFDQILPNECQINEFDPNGLLATFEAQNGIHIEHTIFEKVELPERLKKLYNDQAEERQRRRAQAERLQAEREKALVDAEITKINAEAEAKKIKITEEAKSEAYVKRMEQLVNMLIGKGIPVEKIVEHINTIIASEKGNTIFMNSGNGMANDIAMGGIAANRVSNNNGFGNPNPKSNLEQILEYANTYILLNPNQAQEIQEKITRIQSNPHICQQINDMGTNSFEQLFNSIFTNSYRTTVHNGQPGDTDSSPSRPRR